MIGWWLGWRGEATYREESCELVVTLLLGRKQVWWGCLAVHENLKGCVGGIVIDTAVVRGKTRSIGVFTGLEDIEATSRYTFIVVHMTGATSRRREFLGSSVEETIGHTATAKLLIIVSNCFYSHGMRCYLTCSSPRFIILASMALYASLAETQQLFKAWPEQQTEAGNS